MPASSTSGDGLNGPSPSKRPRLVGPSSSSSSSRLSRLAGSSASTPTRLDDEEYTAARLASRSRVLAIWGSLEERYARAMDEDDIVDLETGKLIQDRGVLRGRSKPWQYGHLLSSGKDKEEDTADDEEGTTTDAGEESAVPEESEDVEGEDAEAEAGESSDGEVRLLRGPNEVDDEGDGDSEDDLAAWDTVPAPSEPETEPPTPDQTTNDETLSFLYANVRPRLEQLAREGEASALPEDDVEAFLAAEAKLRAQPGYVEPGGAEDDEEVISLDRLDLGPAPAGEVAESDGEDSGEDSGDELDDWDTVAAPLDPDADSDDYQAGYPLREFPPYMLWYDSHTLFLAKPTPHLMKRMRPRTEKHLARKSPSLRSRR